MDSLRPRTRAASGRGAWEAWSDRRPGLGRMNMDQCVIDLTEVGPVEEATAVEVVSADPDSPVSLDRVAAPGRGAALSTALRCLSPDSTPVGGGRGCRLLVGGRAGDRSLAVRAPKAGRGLIEPPRGVRPDLPFTHDRRRIKRDLRPAPTRSSVLPQHPSAHRWARSDSGGDPGHRRARESL